MANQLLNIIQENSVEVDYRINLYKDSEAYTFLIVSSDVGGGAFSGSAAAEALLDLLRDAVGDQFDVGGVEIIKVVETSTPISSGS